ncbi:MAG TPA: hypothetical protein DCS67_04220 [Clostridiales bacterium UBA8960]|jgi:ComF family protein|nr:hypothetical protein [Clostridiales bacterium UBA8960]
MKTRPSTHLKTEIRAFGYSILEFLMPENLTCNFCEAELPPGLGSPICESCLLEIEPIDGHLCSICGRDISLAYAQHSDYFFKCKECQERFSFFERHRAFAYYTDGVKKGLMGLKYKKQIYQSVYFGRKLGEMVAQDPVLRDFDHIIPVPIHFLRRTRRGYNQAEVIAHHMAKALGVDGPKEWLCRKRVTKKLKKLDRETRKSMLSGAIMVKSGALSQIKGKKILLVDDIYTTGSTLNTCAKALYEAGCERICCVTVARGR